MKTYQNEKYGFEIDLPENWQPAPIPPACGKDLFQYGCFDESVNFEIGPLFPKPLLDDTETEFRLYARDSGFSEPRFGRIVVAGKEHVCASYLINDNMGRRWNKKYMIVFGRTEYTLTATCNNPECFAKREKDWDAIIRSFRLLVPIDDSANATDRAARYRNQRRDIIERRVEMREITGTLYARAYEAVALGHYKEAHTLLEKCLADNPDHTLARKELAVVLEKLGNIRGALHQRREVRRLAPTDAVNRVKLAQLLAGCGARGEALREARELLAQQPNDPLYRELEARLAQFRYTDYRLMFLGSLACLLLLDIGLATKSIAIRDVWCERALMLLPVLGMYVSGPWVGITRVFSAVLAGALYLFFLAYA